MLPWSEDYVHPGSWEQSFVPCSVADLLRRAAARKPDGIALDFYGRTTRYSNLWKQACRAARGLQTRGIGPGSRVGLFLPNTPHYPIAYYGALLTGATVVNFSPLYSPDEVLAQARDAGIDALVCLDLQRLWSPVQALLDAEAIDRLIVGSLTEVLPFAKALGFRLLKSRERQPLPEDARVVRWNRLLDNDGKPSPVAIDPARDIALIQYTGGTTGVPKGAALSHANLSINAQQLAAIEPGPKRADTRVLGALPLFHIFANTAVLNRAVLSGGEIVLLPKFDPGEALAAIARRRCTDLCGVPAMYQAMLEHSAVARTDFSSVGQCFSGGAAMLPALKNRFEAVTGARLLEGYGMTESAGVASVNPFVGAAKSGTVGQPLPATRILIVDETGSEVARGDKGEIAVAGPQVMQGYWQSAERRIDPLADGLFRTGDIGLIDDDGYIRIVDRAKDMINVGGFKVFPSQLEAVLTCHPAVAEALVIGVEDERVGERPKAFVVARTDRQPTASELLAFLNAKVGKHERVSSLEFRQSLPKTVIGKPDRKALAAEESAKIKAAEGHADGRSTGRIAVANVA
jgi:long-chain acyl-CoA synthetase